jgi:pre-rRNA-processing protein TSR1
LVLEVSPTDKVENFPVGKALILSTLFPNEAKVSTMSFKIKRTVENKDIVPSKQLMEFHCGFRRFECKPIFSSETNPGAATEKYKFNRFLHPDQPSIATIYSPIIFAPCKILCFTESSMKSGKADSIVAVGQVLAPNPLKCILKRIVLTGYPLRVHKKKATIRYMFFNPTDIKYFKPVQL